MGTGGPPVERVCQISIDIRMSVVPESTVFFGEAPKARRGGMIARVKRGGGEKGGEEEGGLLADDGCPRVWQRGTHPIHVDDQFPHHRRDRDLLRLVQVYNQVPVDFS